MARGNSRSSSDRSSRAPRRSPAEGASSGAEGRRHTPSPRRRAASALADLIASIAPAVLRDAFERGGRLDPAIKSALDPKQKLSYMDRRTVQQSLSALARWWGWIAPLKLVQVEEQLLLAWLLDSTELGGPSRRWAEKVGRDPWRVQPGGEAPGWTERATTLKRFMEGRNVAADPWMLVPAWLRDELPLPPGDESAKARRLAFLFMLQVRAPIWAAVRGAPEKQVWNDLRDSGLRPWVHRKLETAAKLDRDTELGQLEPFRRGLVVIEDLASQAVARVCDPDPGERWWDVRGGSGLQALGLGAEMMGKGAIVSTFEHDRARRAAASRIRAGAFRNIAAKAWDGKRAPGKAGTYDGVLLDAPGSGVGIWRRHPEARWSVSKEQISEFVDAQKRLMAIAASAVKTGGTLVYTVATVTQSETLGLIQSFLAENPEFKLEPFPNPLGEGTTAGTLQIWPQLQDCETRFIARMIRTAKPA